MIRTLLTSTALVALLTAGAIAQDAPATPEAPAVQTAPMDKPVDATNGMTETTAKSPTVMSEGYMAVDSDHLASIIIGMPVYSSAANDAENFGEINDLVVSNQGDIVAVVIGVGGFLGLGEKGVSVDYSELQWTTAEDGSERIVLNTTKEALEAAPAFEWRDDNADDAAATNSGNAAVTDTAPANPEGTAAEPVTNPDGTAMDRSTMTDFDEMSATAEELKGTAVYGTNDEQIGTIGDFVLGDDGKAVDAVIVDVGGFLGLGTKPVAVGFENLNFAVDANNNRYLFLNTTKEQLEAQPEFNRDTYVTERDAQRMVVTQ